MSLFREEVVLHKRKSSMGDVSVNVPVLYSYIITPIFVIAIALIIFSMSFEFNRKEKVSGYLYPTKGFSNIKAEQFSVLKTVNVDVGSYVKQGDVLATFTSEKGLRDGVLYTDEMISSITRDKIRIDENLNLIRSKKSRLKKIKSIEKSNLISQKNNIAGQLALINKTTDLKEKFRKNAGDILKKGVISKEQYEQIELDVFDIKRQQMQLQLTLADVEQRILAHDHEVSVELDEVEQQNLIFESQKEALSQRELSMKTSQGYSIVAPRDGIVSSIFVSEGAVLDPGRVIMTIQPENSDLIARMLVPSKSVGLIDVSQKATLFFSSYPYQRYGIYKGTVSKISDNVLSPTELGEPTSTSESVYIVDILLDKQYVEAFGNKYELKSSMKLEAEIITDSLSFFDLIIEPISAFAKKIQV